nr:MAG TPA: stabilization protein [Crassvirales sp.]
MQKSVSFKTKGMQRDLAVSAFNSDFAYENKNIRVITNDDNTLYSLVNERGTKLANVGGIDSIEGTVIGKAVIDNELILFTADTASNIKDKEDKIYKIKINGNNLEGQILFRGNLNFNPKYPIETLVFYENEDIKKVYWTDGLNQPRVINIAAASDVVSKWNTDSFNFVRTLSLNEEITIERNIVANGSFAPGVIQYAFTYFNKYGQESNIFYTSPLYYISYNNRGASPEDKVSNSFNIEVANVDRRFDYIRIYSIHRTSINATPDVRRVVDLAPPINISKVTYTDNGSSGDSVDPTELLYIGGEEVVFGTMTQKDNTLFLGDIETKRKTLDSTIRNYFKGKSITFSSYNKSISSPEPKGYYPYSNQLKMNSYQFKTFKYLEYYRFGIQAQHYTGKWSEPIWINDVRNTVHIDTTFYSSNNIGLPVAEFTLNDGTIINRLLDNGYVRIRPVVVYPTINDREAVCQGILCPTVYNISDRFGNSPFAQSSWFTRPNAPFDEYKAFHYHQNNEGAWGGDWVGLGQFLGNPSAYSRAGIMSNNKTIVTSEEKQYNIDIVNKGAWAEFRHNKPIPGNNNRNAEIQCIWNPPSGPYVDDTATDSDVASWVSNNAENYYIDQSILTFHSPDIEFDNEVRSIDTSGLKLRIVGMVPLTAFASDIDIQTSTPVNNFYDSSELPAGFYKEPIGAENDFSYDGIGVHLGDSHFGWRGLISGAFWFDELTAYKKDTGNTKHLTTGFVVYPWHRNGSLNNTKYTTDGYRSAMLDKKKMSNMRYSYKSVYLDSGNIWNAYESDSSTRTGISGVAVFDSNEVSLVRLPAQENSGLTDINYYGNVDKLLTISRIGDKKDGYPIMTTGVQSAETNAHTLFSSGYTQIDSRFTDQITGTDPVRIKYKSTPHAVLALNYTTSGAQRILPNIKDGEYNDTWFVNAQDSGAPSGQHMYWDKSGSTKSVSQDTIIAGAPRGPISGVSSIQHGWLWLGELYNDNVQNRFGGQTEEAFENNTWLPCGDPISLVDTNNGVKSSITIRWEEGDTYFQRYDHIKTYPFTLEDQNAVTDIVSFMCETRVNIDGRYDRNRGQTSNFSITPENFNLMNDVYSQPNNFFNYRTINTNKLNLDNFHNSITWTKTKTAGELVDTWTNITLASTLDLDGDKGTVRALRRFNNNIIAIQDKGISQILYNENTQISTTEGVPIEIANSGKVQGKRYISDKVGCTNKWSICETPTGIYFVDDIVKGIYLFNGQLNNISDKLGFHSWIKIASKSMNIWNPVDFNSFVTYYDKSNDEILFISRDACLGYSELLNQFTSFYSYENTPYFSNLLDKGIWIRDNKLWLHNEGDYNMFFGAYQPFYTTIIANPDMPVDKIFNNLEFRSDSWDRKGNLLNVTFDTLTVWNEYQQGISKLKNMLGKPSNLKRKFRIWRANIPRAKANGRDRMRNPWLYIKLSMEEENVNKTVLHDMIVHYFE